MHRCLNLDEMVRLLACELVGSELKATAVSLARRCKSFENPVLHVLWETQDRLTPLLKCLPQEVWEEEDGNFYFQRIPTKAEWANFHKYARRMQKLKVNAHNDPVTSEILLALQLRAANEPLLPRLKSFECSAATEAFIPFIPLFLSPQTTNINIAFTEDSPPVAVASIISMLPTLCPNLQCVNMDRLGRDLAITSAVSEMLLTCNKGSLQNFYVDSPLTDEAREVVYRLPNLFGLWVVIEGRTLLPPVALPNLTDIDVQYDDHLDWLQGFREATLENLESVSFRSESIQIGDFLGAFESVALTMSAQNTLSVFRFYTSRSWNPYYSSLLSFKQLKELIIEFACDGGCSSKVNDNVITTLAQAMPKLEILQLGSTPCQTPTGATVYGLIALASRCPHLSKLRIHFRGDSLVSAAMDAATTPLPIKKTDLLREDCALVDLEVGDIPIPPRSNTRVVLMLLQIFPRILNVKYTNPGWKRVAESISDFRRMGAFVQAGGWYRHKSSMDLTM